jgi:hypothetical protein
LHKIRRLSCAALIAAAWAVALNGFSFFVT